MSDGEDNGAAGPQVTIPRLTLFGRESLRVAEFTERGVEATESTR